jgi:hypothetical protein
MAAMKWGAKPDRNAAALVACQRFVAAISSPVLAIAYCHAAQRDEKNGFPFTAAMEWRKAAELLNSIPAAADRCWRHWERLMQLPRRLADPIGGPLYVRDAVNVTIARQFPTSAPDGLIQSDSVVLYAA